MENCFRHPDSEMQIIFQKVCDECAFVLYGIADHVSKAKSLTRRERISYLWQLSQLCITQDEREIWSAKIRDLPFEEVRCIECATSLDADGACPHCTAHYDRLIYSEKVRITEETYEEILDACISEDLKMEFLWMYYSEEAA